MRYIRQFIADAGGWGVASVAACFVFYSWAIWEHTHDKPLSAFLLLAVTIPLFWIGSLVAWWKVRKELDGLKQQSEVIDVRLAELYRTPTDNYSESTFDLFVFVRLELMLPQEVRIANSRLELSVHGVVETMEPINDLNDWEIGTWDSKAYGAEIVSYPVTPLPPTLRKYEPVEGWMHFVTKPTTGTMLERCAAKLVVRTDRGSGYSELAAGTDSWNPRKISISRRVGGQLWNP
jgi:hypothetical protein